MHSSQLEGSKALSESSESMKRQKTAQSSLNKKQNAELNWQSEQMDDLDRQLIAELRDNARLPVATLAQRLKVSRGTVQNRLNRLEADGIIVGYTVRLKPQVQAQRIRAQHEVEPG